MEICTFASSSSGNCALVSHGGTSVLIDAGISMKRITACLRGVGREPEQLRGILITHEHIDHISGLGMMCRRYGIPVYAPSGVARALEGKVPPGGVIGFPAGGEFALGDLTIRSFLTPHDTPESVGYRIYGGERSLLYLTDLGCVTRDIEDAAYGVQLAVIEANHDVEMVKRGPYPHHLKKRILSERGHLSNKVCGHFSLRLAEAGARQLILAHLSRENNTPELAYGAVSAALGRGADTGVRLSVAPSDGLGEMYVV